MCFRWLVVAVLCSVLAPSPDVPEEKDIKCEASGHFIGGIDRAWNLTIRGPKEKKWEYSFRTSPPYPAQEVQAAGTYELVERMAVFTGKVNKDDVRFGLNYGFLQGEVEFNGFFPESDKVLRYRRQWFQQVDGEWKPLEEITLTMPREVPPGEEWKVKVQGERLRWEKSGARTSEKLDQTLTYKQDLVPGAYRLSDPTPEWAPPFLAVKVIDKRFEAVLFHHPQFGVVGRPRGFHPSLARQETGR